MLVALRAWMKKNRWNFQNMGRELGNSPSYLNAICAGKQYASPELAERISLFTGREVAPHEILPVHLGPIPCPCCARPVKRETVARFWELAETETEKAEIA
jgi:DNA-binding transcriptional regulator YdaS (Cro superfamily)